MCKVASDSQCGSFNNSSISAIAMESSLPSLRENSEGDDFAPTLAVYRPSRKQLAPQMLANVMQWFSSRAVQRGDAEGLAERFSLGEIKKANAKREANCSGVSQLLERRLKRKLGVVV